jgi:transposase
VREQTTRERWQRVHHLLDQGVGLIECARRLDVALNTVKRYARTKEPTGDRRAPRYKPTLGFTRLLPTRPENLREKDTALLRELAAACPEMTDLARLTGEFAQLLTPAEDNDTKLTDWITTVRAAGLPHLHSFTNGLELDRAAVDASLTHPYHNGRTEGVNTRTKRVMRQMHGRARFPLLRHRILLQ